MALKLDNSIPKDPYTKQLWGEGSKYVGEHQPPANPVKLFWFKMT